MQLQVFYPYPVDFDGAPLTDEEAKTFIGMFILMNVLFIISLIISTFFYVKRRRKSKSYFYDNSGYFDYLLFGNDFWGLLVINLVSMCINGLVIVIYLGSLIGKML